MSFIQSWFDVAFGAGNAGLSTVGYRLYKNDGTDSVARTTTGVVEIGNGVYGVPDISVPDDAVGIEWDTGGGSPVYAVEDIQPYRDRFSIANSKDIYQEVIHLNTTGAGTSGTDYPTGSFFQPSDNLVDALIIASANNINKIKLTGNLTLSQSVAGYIIEGIPSKVLYSITLNNQNVSGTRFINCGITGQQNSSGRFFAEHCWIDNMTGMDFDGEDIVFTGTSYQVETGGIVGIYRGGVADITTGLIFDMNTVSLVKLDKFNGVITLSNMNNASCAFFCVGNVNLTINSNCLQGICVLYGICTLTNNASNNPNMLTSTNILPNDIFEYLITNSTFDKNTIGKVLDTIFHAVAGDKQRIGNQMLFRKRRSGALLHAYNLYRSDGTLANEADVGVFKRVMVTSTTTTTTTTTTT